MKTKCTRYAKQLSLKLMQEDAFLTNMKKYYLMAIDKDNSNAMCNLGNYYKDINDYELMRKYYLMAIEKENINAMYSLGLWYKEQEDDFNIKEDYEGNIWIGTNAGLTKLDPITNNTTFYYKQKGLPNDFIYSILISRNNNIWVSTNFGLSVLNTKTNTFKNYTVNDGLQNNEFNGKAGYEDETGNFYFGGISGTNIFDPDNIIENPFIPETYIESVELFNKPLLENVLFKDDLEFKSNQNVLTFNFSAINYLNPEKCNYTYIMEGFDSDWRPITKNRSATYTNLDPGKYIFKVKASNDLGIWNEVPKALSITIIPPWYNTQSFKIAFILLLAFQLYKFVLYQSLFLNGL